MPQQELTKLSEQELLQALAAEFRALHEKQVGMRIEVDPVVAFTVVALCQLGLRHPLTGRTISAPMIREFIEYVRAKFEPSAPAIAEAIRRGDDPASDNEPVSRHQQ